MAASHSLTFSQRSRENQRAHFLKTQGYDISRAKPMAADCSARVYFRIETDPPLVLMDADPELGEDVRPFIAITKGLSKNDLAVPQIVAQDIEHGFLLLSDMGDNLFNTHLQKNPADELRLYKAAAEVLMHIHQNPVPERISLENGAENESYQIFPYNTTAYMNELRVFLNWYVFAVTGRPLSESAQDEFVSIWRGLFVFMAQQKPVLVLRDYHADNLFWYPPRGGVKSVGIIDYQDALWGHPAYDLVSLLEDARRDVSPHVAQEVIRYFLAIREEELDIDSFKRDYAILGAQRNLKILGIFVRMALKNRKISYLGYLPRVLGHLKTDFEHPALAPVAAWMDRWVPESLRSLHSLDIDDIRGRMIAQGLLSSTPPT